MYTAHGPKACGDPLVDQKLSFFLFNRFETIWRALDHSTTLLALGGGLFVFVWGVLEVSRCRHAALDRLLLRPTETYAGDPDHCRMMDDSPNDPGVANAWDSSDARGAYEDRPPRAT